MTNKKTIPRTVPVPVHNTFEKEESSIIDTNWDFRRTVNSNRRRARTALLNAYENEIDLRKIYDVNQDDHQVEPLLVDEEELLLLLDKEEELLLLLEGNEAD